jgi:hypothetical protein
MSDETATDSMARESIEMYATNLEQLRDACGNGFEMVDGKLKRVGEYLNNREQMIAMVFDAHMTRIESLENELQSMRSVIDSVVGMKDVDDDDWGL